MLLRRIGVLVAVIVLLFALGRITQRCSRLGVVLVDRVCGRLLDRFRRKGSSPCRCLCRLDPASLGERDLGVAVCGNAAAAASGGVRSLCDSSGVARADGGIVWTSAITTAMAFTHPRPRARPRIAYRHGRDQQVGPDPAVHPPDLIRPERSAVRQGHRLLPLLATGLRGGEEPAAVDPPAGCADSRRNLFPARRHQSGSSRLERFALGNRPLLRAARPLFCG